MIEYGIIILITASILGMIINKEFFTKLIFLSNLNNYTAIFICLLSLTQNNESFIDIAIIYALLSYISSLAIYKRYMK